MLCWGGLYVYVVGGIIVFLVINFVEKSLLICDCKNLFIVDSKCFCKMIF